MYVQVWYVQILNEKNKYVWGKQYCSASQTCPGGPPGLHILYVSLIRHTQFSSCSLY